MCCAVFVLIKLIFKERLTRAGFCCIIGCIIYSWSVFMINFKELEQKWNKYWDEHQTFKTDVWDFSKPKFYCLDMFPYPSGDGLHVGHLVGYVASDAVSRLKRMQGFNVLHPMGFDAFGLPAEQYAIKTGNNPNGFTQKNIENFKHQLKKGGFSFDWSKCISTCDPQYYKWTQWIVEQLYQNGLMSVKDMEVNWCEQLNTVLANDEVIDGKSERGGFPVVKRKMRQWVVDTPAFAEKLLEGLNDLDWPESTKTMQRNWIGKSEGAKITFHVADSDLTFDVFTTRADTLFGATFCALSPQHPIVQKIVSDEQRTKVTEFAQMCAQQTQEEQNDTTKEKLGVFTGAYAINPVNSQHIPIYVTNYVLEGYGTGALMAVPAHDERDFEFATKYNIPIIQVIEGGVQGQCYTGDGKHINSDFLNGMDVKTAKHAMIEWLEEHKLGTAKTNYRIREWIFARQHYWGEPMPMFYDEDGKTYLVPTAELPLTLPEIDNYQAQNGVSPLANATQWANFEKDGKHYVREVNTMPSSAGSSWYFLRYIDPQNSQIFADKKLLDHWMPVDLYVGGAEHAVGHLLYSRMWNRFLFEQGYLNHPEPFKKLVHQGLLLASDGRKMSKRWGNVVNPDTVIDEYGADTIRMYMMFMGPVQETKPWNNENIAGVARFLEKIWSIYTQSGKIKDQPNPSLDKVYNATVKKVTQDFENMDFNTAISQMMIFVNAVSKAEVFPTQYAQNFLKMLNPLAPYITEELWATVFGNTKTIAYEPWPTFDPTKLEETTVEMVVQINGKVRDKMTVPANLDDETAKTTAQNLPNIKKLLADKTIKKIVVIKNKLVNIVAV